MNALKNSCIYGLSLSRRLSSCKTAISLENLYPQSSLKLSTVEKPQISKEFNGYIPLDSLSITYSKSSGPGGQNVNKVNTKVDLRFHVESANWLNEDVKKKIAEQFKTKITKDGFLVFKSDLTRYQQLNLADCLEKLRNVIRAASAIEQPVSTPESEERLRRRREKAVRERLIIKRNRSQVKADRQGPEKINL